MAEYIMLFVLFFKIGAFSFGGGLAMLPVIFQQVSEYNLINSGDFANLVAISQVTPGPVVVNAATYIGFNYSGFIGAVMATLGVSIPSFAVVLLAMKFLDKFNESRTVKGILCGVMPATAGLIGAGTIFMAKEVPVSYITLVIFCATVIMSRKFKMNPIIIVVIMAIAGGLLCG